MSERLQTVKDLLLYVQGCCKCPSCSDTAKDAIRLIESEIALVASPQAEAQREGGQVTPKMMSEVFAASVTNTDPEHEHLYDHRIAAELLNKMLASPPSGEPGDPSDYEGHGKPCYYCKEPCNDLAGNPSKWSLAFPHKDEPGVVKWHHTGCVMERLIENQPAARASDESGERLQSARWLELITEQDIRGAYQSAPNWHSVLSSLQCRAIKKYQDATAALVSTPAPSEGNESARAMSKPSPIDALCERLTDERHNRADDQRTRGTGPERELTPNSEEEKRVWEALEQARQNVKSIVKKEMEAEIVTTELLNLRLRNQSQ